MRAGPPAVCPGRVWHRRTTPREHEFVYTTSHVWIDPDRPDTLCDLHPRWSTNRPDVVRFRAADYGRPDADPAVESLADQARHDLTPVLGRTPEGPVRMVSQLRRWGWLFNPLSVFVVWDAGDEVADRPVGAVLEVTNTPWNERHRYPLALTADVDGDVDGDGQGAWTATFAKALHVSPFLTLDHEYRLRLADRDDRVEVAIDVVDGDGAVVLATALSAERLTADRATVAAATWRPILPTHRVSLGIHVQAARLWRRGVPFVPHPNRHRESQGARR